MIRGNYRFYFRDHINKDGTTRIYLQIKKKRILFKYNLKAKVYPEFKDNIENGTNPQEKKLSQASFKYKLPKVNLKNNVWIARKEVDKMAEILHRYELIDPNFPNNYFDKEKLRAFIENELAGESVTYSEMTLFTDYVDSIIKEFEKGTLLNRNGKAYEYGTIKKFKQFSGLLKEYQRIKRKSFKIADINLNVINNFLKYMEEAGNAPSYIVKHKKIFIHFAKIATSKDLLNEKALKGNSFNPSTKNTEYINLSESEIQKIYEVQVKEKSLEAKAKDVFLLCCYTGQNYIDVAEIKESDIVRDGDRHYWIVHRKKTGKRVPILLNYKAFEILKKRDFKLNHLISIQHLNKKIKILGKKAGINDKVTLIKGNEPITKEKWEFLVSHTGRRSFLNILFDNGMKERQIMEFSTHGSLTTLEPYLNVKEKEIKKKMLEIGFFN